MTEKPILMTGDMVRATLAGRKTQARRPIGLQTMRPSQTPGYDWTFRGQAPVRSIAQQARHQGGCWQDLRHAELMALSPHGQHGDRLWVRETWRTYESLDHRRPASIGPGAGIQYEAGGTSIPGHGPTLHGMGKLRPSTHMPRWACRLVLEIVDVRVERLQDITEEDVRPEGLSCWATEWVDDKGGDVIKHWGTAAMENRSDTARDAFGKVWSSIYGAESWAANPYVWAISFKRVGAEP